MERLTERTAIGVLVKEDYGEKALKTLYSCNGGTPDPHYTNCDEGYCAMEKLAAYEDVGAVSTCRNAVEICRAMIERGIESENVEAYIAFEDECVKKGFTIKGLLEAGEKQTAKRPREYEDKYYGCPTCGNILLHKWEKYPDKLMDKSNGLPYCLGCGQKLDWSDEV